MNDTPRVILQMIERDRDIGQGCGVSLSLKPIRCEIRPAGTINTRGRQGKNK